MSVSPLKKKYSVLYVRSYIHEICLTVLKTNICNCGRHIGFSDETEIKVVQLLFIRLLRVVFVGDRGILPNGWGKIRFPTFFPHFSSISPQF